MENDVTCHGILLSDFCRNSVALVHICMLHFFYLLHCTQRFEQINKVVHYNLNLDHIRSLSMKHCGNHVQCSAQVFKRAGCHLKRAHLVR